MPGPERSHEGEFPVDASHLSVEGLNVVVSEGRRMYEKIFHIIKGEDPLDGQDLEKFRQLGLDIQFLGGTLNKIFPLPNGESWIIVMAPIPQVDKQEIKIDFHKIRDEGWKR